MVMTAVQGKAALMGAGCPEDLLTAAEAKGLHLGELWQFVQKFKELLADVDWEKVWEVARLVISLFPAAAIPPS